MCQLEKPLTEFHRAGGCRNGRRPECKICIKQKHRDYYAKNSGLRALQARLRRSNNPERSRAVSWQYYAVPRNRAKRLIYLAKGRAKKRGIPCDLDIKFIEQKLILGKCEATGIPFEFGADIKRRRHPFAPSIDRIDPTKGYTKENIQVVVFVHNAARGDWGDAIIAQYVRALMTILERGTT